MPTPLGVPVDPEVKRMCAMLRVSPARDAGSAVEPEASSTEKRGPEVFTLGGTIQRADGNFETHPAEPVEQPASPPSLPAHSSARRSGSSLRLGVEGSTDRRGRDAPRLQHRVHGHDYLRGTSVRAGRLGRRVRSLARAATVQRRCSIPRAPW